MESEQQAGCSCLINPPLSVMVVALYLSGCSCIIHVSLEANAAAVSEWLKVSPAQNNRGSNERRKPVREGEAWCRNTALTLSQ